MHSGALVDDYVFGHAIRARESTRAAGDEGFAAKLDAAQSYLETQLATGEFPRLQELFGEDARAGLTQIVQLSVAEERFERGLQLLLDGIELDLARRRA
jgi:hypothetical protein